MACYGLLDNLIAILRCIDPIYILDCFCARDILKENDEKFWIDKITSANAFELYVSGLSTHSTSQGDTCDAQMVEAAEMHFTEAKKFPVNRLTPMTSYRVSFFLTKKEDNEGLDQTVTLKLLQPNQSTVEITPKLSSIATEEWTEIQVGDFKTPYDDMYGDMEVSITLTNGNHQMNRFVNYKILIQPVTRGWKELCGENEWHGLLDPLNLDLSMSITDYGKRVDAIYDCITTHENCKEKDFFSKFGPDKGKTMRCQTYKVKKYIYLYIKFSPSVVQSKRDLIGYVAVATSEGVKFLGRRDILVCWRGTSNIEEWIKNLNFLPTRAEVIYPNVHGAKVHTGFYSIYTESNKKHGKKSARDQVIDEVKELVNKYGDEEVSITITGHSLGAALATLNAADIVSHGYNKPDHNPESKEYLVTTFVFGSPKVVNKAFKTEFNNHEKLRLLRIENVDDPVTKLPPKFYARVGNVIRFTRTNASSDENGKKSIDHNLKNYVKELHALSYRPLGPSLPTLGKRKNHFQSSPVKTRINRV